MPSVAGRAQGEREEASGAVMLENLFRKERKGKKRREKENTVIVSNFSVCIFLVTLFAPRAASERSRRRCVWKDFV